MDGQPCKLSIHHERERKTGPCFPLWVMWCSTHQRSFTIYPPGHVPYGRKPLIIVATDGGRVLDLENGAERFRGTVFDAALDASLNKPWGDKAGVRGVWSPFSTQIHQIQRAAAILGLEPDIHDDQRHAIAQTLMLPSLLLHAGAACFAANSGYQKEGEAICSVLKALPETTSLFERLAETGFQTGLWPAPFFVDPDHKWLRPSRFQHFRTRAPPTSI